MRDGATLLRTFLLQVCGYIKFGNLVALVLIYSRGDKRLMLIKLGTKKITSHLSQELLLLYVLSESELPLEYVIIMLIFSFSHF